LKYTDVHAYYCNDTHGYVRAIGLGVDLVIKVARFGVGDEVLVKLMLFRVL